MDAHNLFNLDNSAYPVYSHPLSDPDHHLHQGLFLASPPSLASLEVPAGILLDGPSAQPAHAPVPVPVPPDFDDGGSSSDAVSRPRKMHQCAMCHKSYDRPSTLRIHQRVHTLAKDYECTRCERRFSVASNLKRHSRKCGAHDVPGFTSLGSTSATLNTIFEATSPGSSEDASTSAPKPKRPRRKKSGPQWVPDSLKCFASFGGAPQKLPMPFPPSCPDPYSADVGEAPYRNTCWKGALPGPAAKQIFRIDARSFM